MTDKKRNLFVTTALPYANGPFHIGHIMEYIQADIWVRHERMCGNNVHWVGADDTHGAPIMIAAQKKGITPQQFVAEIAAGRKEYLDDFYIKFDFWHSTDSPENHELSQDIYRRLKAAGLIYTKDIEQFYDTEKNMFLADRFIKGTCPKCGAEDQYGDSCEVCGSVYAPTDLKNPKSALSGTTPVIKKSTHYFFKLSDPRAIEFLREWTRGNGADGKPFKTRDGGVMNLEDLIALSKDKVRESMPKPEETDGYDAAYIENLVGEIAIGAIKFQDLKNTISAGYVFELEDFAKFEGKTGPYIQYAIARINSILRKAKEKGKEPGNIVITNAEERVLALKLAQFNYLSATVSKTCPILLLDDVFDKLDAMRVEQIVRLVSGEAFGQIFITDTNRDHLDSILEACDSSYRIFNVEGGKIV